MKVYRLTRKKYSKDLSGKDAAKSGNRWNSKGIEIIYTAESRALAMAEVSVHLTLATLPSDFVMMEIDIPDDIKIKVMEENDLPDTWNNHPPNISSQIIGDEFIDTNDFCLLKVPSAIVHGDYNYLINPHHQHFKKIKVSDIKDFPFDKRIFK